MSARPTEMTSICEELQAARRAQSCAYEAWLDSLCSRDHYELLREAAARVGAAEIAWRAAYERHYGGRWERRLRVLAITAGGAA